jgi:hypothetical protein
MITDLPSSEQGFGAVTAQCIYRLPLPQKPMKRTSVKLANQIDGPHPSRGVVLLGAMSMVCAVVVLFGVWPLIPRHNRVDCERTRKAPAGCPPASPTVIQQNSFGFLGQPVRLKIVCRIKYLVLQTGVSKKPRI